MLEPSIRIEMVCHRRPIRRIRSSAPTRICDIGGWTDTWFAQHGRVVNFAVAPTVDVQVDVFPSDGSTARFTIDARNFGDRYTIAQPNGNYGKHPIIEAVLDCVPQPEDLDLELSIWSDAPAGCSAGTSAAVSVALIAALKVLTGAALDPHAVAATAHRVETEFLHRQCGVQDQLAAAFGGINLIEMHSYPQATVERVEISKALEQELEARLALVYVGQSHSSSEVHEMVIRQLESAGAGAPQLERLRVIAARARDALLAGDLAGFGRAMIDNTNAQADLHPELVGESHRQIIAVAREYGALGWKVNGAGGEGGSVTLLGAGDRRRRGAMLQAITDCNPQYREIPVRLSASGVRVWDTPPNIPRR